MSADQGPPYVRLQAGAIGEVEVLSRERARSR